MSVIELHTLGSETISPLLNCDVCIIGSGPAGSTVARELSGSGISITLLESGGRSRDSKIDTLNEIDNIGRMRAEQWSVRNRILGGSSHTWGGRCAPFDEIDFEYRSWVENSGWPFDLKSMEPYLARSAPYLGLAVGNGFSDNRFWAIAGKQPPLAEMDPNYLESFFWQFSRDLSETYPFEYMRFGRHIENQLGKNVTLVTGATVSRINTVDNGKAVRSVEFFTMDRRTHTVHAPVIILCTGGIENARILLNSNSANPKGLGNDTDQVGRYLMDHVRGPVASFDVKGSEKLQRRFGRFNVAGKLFRAGFRLSPDVQRKEGLLNSAGWLGEVLSPDDPWISARRLMGTERKSFDDFKNILANANFMIRGARDYFAHKNGFPRKMDALTLECMVEQVPDPNSRITLSDRADMFGMRLPVVNWKVHPLESKTMRRTARIAVDQFACMGFPKPKLEQWVLDEADFPDDFVDVAHPTGTTRMSDDPQKGVVDPYGQVHGVQGLYACGTSVFPTAGHCNPTQMIVSMAIRLSDHLNAQKHAFSEAVV